MILIPTVPHTGTHFTRDHLLVDHDTYCRHLFPQDIDELAERALEWPTVVPIRHPMRVATSFARRRQDMDEIRGYWQRLIERIDPADPYYLPVDRPDRQIYLDEINAGLGLLLETDWPILRCEPHVGLEDLQLTHAQIRDYSTAIMAEWPAFFARWYGPMPE